MRPRNELWQGYFGYWQNRFIHHHLLTIGYSAWIGYKQHGRGVVVCDVVDTVTPSIDWSVDTVAFQQWFIPHAQAEGYLQAVALAPEAVTAVLSAIATYEPTKAIVVLVIGNGTVDINLLQNLAISPPECCEQVQRRWAEFQSDLSFIQL
ncbi:hypothetical protein H6F76_25670 [Leptolyngbya sp. FACHB-321]|uniref:hypothetical protein n=1 Tax=Leptolyngbya sp. FACHB-321 TaxID=2692807 RepID=UPI0016838A31|nr:hypothetical protein [Leptolyngbya sp. FACHB-321]MBD2038346.1 hypothetical protein [Leptolyngbya sp. FACHB-321]